MRFALVKLIRTYTLERKYVKLLIFTIMSKISRLVSALAGDAYKEAKAIYDDILSTGTEREKQDARYIMKVM